MPQDLLHKLIYALIAGLTAFLPVSSEPHQMLYSIMTGFEHNDVFLSLSIHLGSLVALLISCKARIKRLSHERRLSRISRKRRNRQPDIAALLDVQVLKTAAIPLLLSLLLCRRAGEWISGVLLMTLTLLLNGVLLFIPRLLPQGDKDGRALSRLDSVLIGMGGGLGAVPGFSRLGGILWTGLARGVDRQYILDTGLLLCIPATIGLLILDIFAAAAAQAVLSGAVVLCIATGALAFGGAMLGIALMRYLSVKAGFTGFSYYSIGLGLFSFILYLMI